ncbi:unnamed protein product [Phyllotreta striolata]|uniref:Uncharacterized protein n=1 Tax=Phyllotreta striolata TaxID=444603 RepID=A0A9N9TQ49_PHYSR|nr:unnamed protein product [Phyllotreta striolata]
MDRILPEKNKICRLCLSETVIYYSLLEEDRALFLETLTSIKVDEHGPMPTNACIKCCLSLKYAFQIQQNILEADRKLRLLNNQVTENENVFVFSKSVEIAKKDCNNDEAEIVEKDLFKTLFNKENEFDEEMPLTNFHEIKTENSLLDSLPDEPDAVLIKTENEHSIVQNENVIELPVILEDSNTDNATQACKICGLDFPEKELMEHIQFHYFSTVKCDECNMPCENIHSYRSHLLEEHKDIPANKNWVCKICQVRFLYKPLYIIHFRSAHPVKTKTLEDQTGAFPCSYCKKKFHNEKRRDAHMSVHKKKQCDICGVYITPTNFPAHRKSHLEEEVECPICGRKYKNTVSLKGHIHYTHSQRTYMCEFCEKTFKKSYSLLLHIKREHTGEKSHICDLCGKSFLTFYNLSKHKKMTHQKLRPFQCEYCQKKFSSKFALRTHERQHTLDAPFKCDLCNQSFRQKVSLKSHKKSVHNVEEPLTCACEVCGKRFSSKFAVMSHMRLH